MNRKEAKSALAQGKRLTHPYFSPPEWVKGHSEGMYIFEDGVKCEAEAFWTWRTSQGFNRGWEVIDGEP